ncbi:MAG: AzlD domain-containing protein [Burkholderiales bacterium]|jgi:branched-subunit amino acid transport protein|nr:AzlD domain-containing protein [Burkholderiales bacterium]
MDTLALAGLILALAATSFGTRSSFILFLGRRAASPALQQALRFVPPAVLTALVLPELVMASGSPSLVGNARLAAGVVAAAVAWKTRNTILTILAGMLCLHALRIAGYG